MIILLIAALLLPCLLTGCNDTPPENTTPETTTPEVTPLENEEIIDPPYEGPDLTTENVLKRADIVVTGSSEPEVYAGEELAAYLTKKGVEVKGGGFPIIICLNPTLKRAKSLWRI